MRRDFTKCPRCGSHMITSIAFDESKSEFWKECTKCPTYVNTYIPQAHQHAVHLDTHLYKGNFGGYGTGKTLTSREEIYKHIVITPDANVLVGSKTASQFEQTIKRDIEKDIPKAFVTKSSVQKAYMDFLNGSRLLFRPFDDADKLRSYNLSMWVIVEASETPAEVFHQLKTRLRNMKATTPKRDADGNIMYHKVEGIEIPIPEFDWRKGIIESNPDAGWIRTDVLLVSEQIEMHGSIMDEYHVLEDAKDRFISSHVASTDVNAYLPPTFVEELTKNKPAWWTARYILSSFSYAEGMVYPNSQRCVIESFEIPGTWKRILAADYGLADDFVYLLGAIDEQNGILHIYKELSTNNRNIEELSRIFFEFTDHIPVGMWYTQPLLDPKSGAKRDYDKKDLFTHFQDFGIYFQPGHISVDARVFRLNTYIEADKLRIHDNCEQLVGELAEYKFPDKKLGKSTKAQNKPMDKNNHAINPLEWITMELPADPAKLVYGHWGPGNSGDDLRAIRDKYYNNPLATPDKAPTASHTNFDFRGGKL